MTAGAAGHARRDRGPLRAARVSVIAAVFLIAIKLVAGLASGSLALVGEAAHSGTDLVAALLTFAVLRIALRPADAEHQYGHGKAEHLAALGEGTFLLLVSVAIAIQAVIRLIEPGRHEVHAAWWTFAVMALVIAIDVGRVVTLSRAAARHNSAALRASALHFVSDGMGTIAVIAGLVLVAAGFERGDPIAALVVAVLVVLAAGRLIAENANVLMDRAPAGVEQRVRDAAAAAEPGARLRRVRVRTAGGHHFVEVVAGYPADAGLGEGHAVADGIETAVQAALPGADVVVHVEPDSAGEGLRGRAAAAAGAVRGVREVHNVRVVEVDGRPELSLHLKLPAGIDLEEAHRVACAVEDAIADAVPELADIHIHLEPLTALPRPAESPSGAESVPVAAVIERLVREQTGAPPRRLDLRAGDGGLVALLTIEIEGRTTLEDAHRRSSALVHAIHAAAPELAEVVVHTEPAGPGGHPATAG